jgi:hypothetical protein
MCESSVRSVRWRLLADMTASKHVSSRKDTRRGSKRSGRSSLSGGISRTDQTGVWICAAQKREYACKNCWPMKRVSTCEVIGNGRAHCCYSLHKKSDKERKVEKRSVFILLFVEQLKRKQFIRFLVARCPLDRRTCIFACCIEQCMWVCMCTWHNRRREKEKENCYFLTKSGNFVPFFLILLHSTPVDGIVRVPSLKSHIREMQQLFPRSNLLILFPHVLQCKHLFCIFCLFLVKNVSSFLATLCEEMY